MSRPYFALLLAVSLACCGVDSRSSDASSLPMPSDCTTDEFLFVSWTLDGERGSVCSSDVGARCTSDPGRPAGFPPLECGFSGHPQCFYPSGYTSVLFRLYNTELASGASGDFVAEPGRNDRRFPEHIGRDGRESYSEVKLGIDLPGGLECGSGMDDNRYSIAGRWQVLVAGDEATPAEVEVREVDFDPVDGRAFRVLHAYWRVRLLDRLVPPREPEEPDGSVP